LVPGTVFLNHGSFGACPEAILRRQEELRRQMEAEPVQFLWRRYEERLEPSRATVARFVGAQPQDLVFVTNATSGVNAVVRSLNLRQGEELLTTSHDYNACHNVLLESALGAGARLVVATIPFPLPSEEEAVAAVLEAVTPRTRLAMIDHVTSPTALVLPAARLVRELAARGVDTLVDGAHAPGMLPLDLDGLGAAYYTGNLHKWPCAPKGTAFLWVRRDKQAAVQPAIISHGNNTSRPAYSAFQDRFDWAGTFDPSGWFCAGAAIDWLGELLAGGWPEVYRRNHELATQARRLLCDRLGVAPPCPNDMLGAMATVPLPERFQDLPKTGKIDAEQSRLYDEFGVEVPFMRFGQPARRYLRVSSQLYNTLAEYEYLAEAIERL
jgi:isopenicillin-N epimerase